MNNKLKKFIISVKNHQEIMMFICSTICEIANQLKLIRENYSIINNEKTRILNSITYSSMEQFMCIQKLLFYLNSPEIRFIS